MREIEESIQEIPTKTTTNFLHKSLRGIKSFLYKRRQKLPDKSTLVRPFACGSTRQQHLLNQTYSWESDHEDYNAHNMTAAKTNHGGGGGASKSNDGSFMKFAVKKEELGAKGKVEIKKGKRTEDKSELHHMVEEKMKELEMMDVGDMENVLDMEEALHYYSRLRSPVYLGIVNKFLMDIYSDVSHVPDNPETSASIINSSKRRFSSTRL